MLWHLLAHSSYTGDNIRVTQNLSPTAQYGCCILLHPSTKIHNHVTLYVAMEFRKQQLIPFFVALVDVTYVSGIG